MISKVKPLAEKIYSLALGKTTKSKTSTEKKGKAEAAVIVNIGSPPAVRPTYNKKGYLGSDSMPELTYPKKSTPKQEAFYNKTHDLLEEARNNPMKAKSIVESIKDPTKDIRTYSSKEQGEKRGSGEDEIFMTAETKTFVERSAGIVEGKYATSYHYNSKGEKIEFDWIDAQKDVRNPTKYQIYNNGQAHSGALYKLPSPSRKGGLTVGQANYHRVRNEEILKSSTPRNAAIRGLRKDLELTPNAEKFDKVVNKGFDCKDRDMSKPEEKAEAKIEFLIDRNRRKKVHEFLLNKTLNDDDASQVSDYSISSDD